MFQVGLMQEIGYKEAQRLRGQKEVKVLSPRPGSCLCPGCPCAAQVPCWGTDPQGDLGSAVLHMLLEPPLLLLGPPGQQLPSGPWPLPLLKALPGADKCLLPLPGFPSPTSVSYWLNLMGSQLQESLGNVVFRCNSGGSRTESGAPRTNMHGWTHTPPLFRNGQG